MPTDGALGAEILLPQRRVVVVAGLDEIVAFDRRLDDLARDCECPVTARWPWISGSIDEESDTSALLVEDDRGDLVAAAVLTTGSDGVTRLASGGDGHRAAVPAADDDAAARLADALWTEMGSRRGFEFGPLPGASAATAAVLESAPTATLVQESKVPVVRRQDVATATHYLTRNMRRTLRRARNHLVCDRIDGVVRRSGDAERIERALPHLAALGRERDHAAGRTGIFDDSSAAERWRRRTVGLARLGLAEMSALVVDGTPAAVNVAFVDPPYYRVLEGRIDTRFTRYAPGRLLEAALLDAMHQDPRFEFLDWMTSLAPEQLLAFNDYEATVTLVGC